MNPEDLRKRIDAYGIPKLAAAAGVPVSTLYSFVDGKSRNMRSDTLAKVVKALESQTNAAALTVAGAEYLPVPVYDIRAAAGAGSVVEDGTPISYQVFPIEELRTLTRAPTAMLSVITVSGDSMEPTIYGGDQVLVDHTIRTIDVPGLYILRLDDSNIIKRCEKSFETKAVLIISDNPRYTAQSVKSSDRLQVIGRVIWMARPLR